MEQKLVVEKSSKKSPLENCLRLYYGSGTAQTGLEPSNSLAEGSVQEAPGMCGK
ncbi:TonB-linked outer membrane protein [Anopheles sinensis]|uniref:TonB-linked outer membrane protein n=1 Tax=Anopheles sinensis TaxID=74873 RepID=A0A084W7L7_ANOSI|nr:TonB-linked outer membrane protein [Anopheles sinensis]